MDVKDAFGFVVDNRLVGVDITKVSSSSSSLVDWSEASGWSRAVSCVIRKERARSLLRFPFDLLLRKDPGVEGVSPESVDLLSASSDGMLSDDVERVCIRLLFSR